VKAGGPADLWLDIPMSRGAERRPTRFDYRESATAPPWHFVTSAPLQIGICSH